MFDIGLSELIVIMVIALLVIGPKKLPEVARALGKGLAEFKRALDDVKEEFNAAQIQSDVREMKESLLSGKENDENKQEEQAAVHADTGEPTSETTIHNHIDKSITSTDKPQTKNQEPS